jgi:hypothetical protein
MSALFVISGNFKITVKTGMDNNEMMISLFLNLLATIMATHRAIVIRPVPVPVKKILINWAPKRTYLIFLLSI